jgi:hypothetical protein
MEKIKSMKVFPVKFNNQRVKLDLLVTQKKNPSNQRKKARQTRKTICSPVELPIL